MLLLAQHSTRLSEKNKDTIFGQRICSCNYGTMRILEANKTLYYINIWCKVLLASKIHIVIASNGGFGLNV